MGAAPSLRAASIYWSLGQDRMWPGVLSRYMTMDELRPYFGKRVKLVKHTPGSPIVTDYVGTLVSWDDDLVQLGPNASLTTIPEGTLNGAGLLAPGDIETIEEI